MKKTILSLALLFILCFMILQISSVSFADDPYGTCGADGDNLLWVFDEASGILRISGNGAMEEFEWYGGAPWYVFSEQIKNVSLPYGITSISSYAFYDCSALENIIIPDTVSRIGRWAFYDCKCISSLTIPDSVTSIEEYAFSYCSGITYLKIGTGLKTISNSVFFNCVSLSEVVLSNSIKKIEDDAFYKCISLQSIDLPDGVQIIGASAFGGCTGLKSITLPDSILSIGNAAFHGCTSLERIRIPTYLTEISQDTFRYCTSLQEVIIPNHVLVIGNTAFWECPSLLSITIPDSVETIGTQAIGYYYNENTNQSETIDGFTIYCYEGSTAIQYAIENGIKYVILTVPQDPCENGHDWALPIYVWAEDYSTVTAIRYCKNDSSHVEAETVNTTSEVTTPATCLGGGETTYTATFKNEAFETQTKTVENLASLGHDWDDGVVTVAATYTSTGIMTFTCSRCEEIKTEEIPKLEMVNPFEDVPEGAYYNDAVLWAFFHDPQITTGTDDTHFGPDKTCTRAQVVTFLWRAKGCPEPTADASKSPFSDVKTSAYYFKAVLWAVEKNITTGTGGGKFSPDNSCTRGQVVTFLWRAEGQPKPTSANNPFKDVIKGQYYYDAVLWAVANKITSGTSATTFSPNQTCTRAQVVTFLWRTATQPTSSGDGDELPIIPIG